MDSAVIDRLSASRITGDPAAFATGRRLGREWAETDADYRELGRIARNREELMNYDQSDPDEPLLTFLIITMLHPLWTLDHASRDWGWIFDGDLAEEACSDPELVRGFIVGAAEVFDEYWEATAN